MAHLGVKLKPDTCFGIVSGAHTYFLAADTAEEVSQPGYYGSIDQLSVMLFI